MPIEQGAVPDPRGSIEPRPAGALLERRPAAMRIVRKYVWISAAAGFINVPVVDVASLGAVHVALIKEITEHYGASFDDHVARNIVIAIVAGLVPGSVGSIVWRRALRALPFALHGVGLTAGSVFSAAVSYGLGLLFIRHFEAGGTLDSFDPKNLHRFFWKSGVVAEPHSQTT